MKSISGVLFSLFVLFLVSCGKKDKMEDNLPTPTPPKPATWEWFKLTGVERISLYQDSYKHRLRDSIEIELNSAKNEIILRKNSFSYNNVGYDKNTSVETFTYNSNHQLVLYEHADSYNNFSITRMQFVRNANGQVEKVLSQYKNGLVASSEGIVKYQKNFGVTTITYLDSTLKNPSGSSDAQDHYEVKLVNDQVVERMSWPDFLQKKYEYDTSGNKIKVIAKHNNDAPIVSKWRWTEFPNYNETKQLQRFLTQWMGDLHWFTRSKQFDFAEFINVSPATGKALRVNYTDTFLNISLIGYNHYYNGSDGFMWGKAPGTMTGGLYDSFTYIENYFYRP
jgi:hypothetical protein